MGRFSARRRPRTIRRHLRRCIIATATNTAAASFPTATTQTMVDDSRVVTHYSGWTTETGGDDLYTVTATGSLSDRTIASAGQTLTIPATELVLTVASDAVSSDDGAERGVRGYIAGGIWWQAHYGAPGTNRTAKRACAGPRANSASGLHGRAVGEGRASARLVTM